MSKLCTICGETKPVSEFTKNRQTKDGMSCRCKPCKKTYDAERYAANPESKTHRTRRFRKDNPKAARAIRDKYDATHPDAERAARYKRQYGITIAQYDVMLKEQGGGCAICGVKPKNLRLAVDHDHKTKRTRGLLCHMCNRGLAHFRDKPERFEAAAAYLRK